MKSLYESILDVDDNIDKIDEVIISQIKQFIKDNFKGYASCKISKRPNSDGKYEVFSDKTVEVRKKNRNITSLTNGLFIWTKVDGSFYCSSCYSLTSLEGAPKEVGGSFRCGNCRSLKSLEGAPKKIDYDFDCYYCSSLKSLEGAPEEVGANFDCQNCGKKFTEEDVKKISNIKGKIYC